jgi:hypothetical protein
MAIVVEVNLVGVTPAQYDQVREICGWLDTPPIGGLSHVTWWEGEVCRNIDAWEDEVFQAFAQDRLAPAIAQAGLSTVPEVVVHPAHEVFVPRQLTLTASS